LLSVALDESPYSRFESVVMSIRNDVILAAMLIARNQIYGEGVLADQLITHGYDPLRAELLLAFVPLGLARAIIRRLADHSIRLPETAIIRHADTGVTHEVELNKIVEFVEAEHVGEESFASGILSKEELIQVSGLRVELNLINQALNARTDVSEATLGPPILLRLAQAPGFEPWLSEVDSLGKPSN
jgi:hypothetical protein